MVYRLTKDRLQNGECMNTKRLGYLDMAKGIGIILVVAGHSGLVSENLLTWLASFHMPLFFMISGMLFFHKKEEDKAYGESIRKKARGILLPYFYFSIIYMMINVLYIFRHPELFTWDIIVNNLLETTSLYGISVLWFLPALFIGEAVFLFLRKNTMHWVTILVSLMLGAMAVILKNVYNASFPAEAGVLVTWIGYLLQALMRVGVAVLFLAVGYYTHALMQKREVSRLASAIAAVVLFVIHGCLALFNGRVDLHFMVFNNPVVYFVTAFVGTMAVIFCCKALPEWKGLTFLGENSLIVMATHLDCQVMICAIRVGMFVSGLSPRAKDYIYVAVTALALLVAEVILIIVINRFFPFLIGKKRSIAKKTQEIS